MGHLPFIVFYCFTGFQFFQVQLYLLIPFRLEWNHLEQDGCSRHLLSLWLFPCSHPESVSDDSEKKSEAVFCLISITGLLRQDHRL